MNTPSGHFWTDSANLHKLEISLGYFETRNINNYGVKTFGKCMCA